MNKSMKKLFCFLLMAAISLTCVGETITLKSGQSVEGKIIETTKDHIKIEVDGVALTYWKDDLKDTSILEQNAKTDISIDAQHSNPVPDDKVIEGLTMKDAGEFISYYYRNPQPARLILILKFILTQQKFMNEPGHLGPIKHFFATLASDDTKILEELNSLLSRYSGTQKEFLNSIIVEAKNFKSPEPDSPTNLDNLWAEFMASGRPEPVKKIISVLWYPAQGQNILLIAAAQWSLTSNAAQHQRVFEIIKKESFEANSAIKEKLQKVLIDAQKEMQSQKISD